MEPKVAYWKSPKTEHPALSLCNLARRKNLKMPQKIAANRNCGRKAVCKTNVALGKSVALPLSAQSTESILFAHLFV